MGVPQTPKPSRWFLKRSAGRLQPGRTAAPGATGIMEPWGPGVLRLRISWRYPIFIEPPLFFWWNSNDLRVHCWSRKSWLQYQLWSCVHCWGRFLEHETFILGMSQNLSTCCGYGDGSQKTCCIRRMNMHEHQLFWCENQGRRVASETVWAKFNLFWPFSLDC